MKSNVCNARCLAMVLAVMVAALTGVSESRAGTPETYTKLDVPGAVVTIASGVNPDGSVVGWYCQQLPCNASRFRGFLLQGGVYTTIHVPASPDRPAIGTQARYISPQGVVLGNYFSLENAIVRQRGFAWYEGTFTFFDAPSTAFDNPADPQHIIPRAINANGDIVGCIHGRNTMESMHGFTFKNGAFTTVPDGFTMNNGITSAGDVVGLDFMTGTGYLMDSAGNQETLTFPGAYATEAWDINARGEIVGVAWTNSGTVPHAYLRGKGGVYRVIDPAGALAAQAFGISSNGTVVGSYRDASGSQCGTTPCTHGFVLGRGEE
ncbi:MAG TPA: hypothetical protein VMZ25_01020 [Terriglobales bacterium]|nr:hypothetical protein [Terriglobales bacterium]